MFTLLQTVAPTSDAQRINAEIAVYANTALVVIACVLLVVFCIKFWPKKK